MLLLRRVYIYIYIYRYGYCGRVTTLFWKTIITVRAINSFLWHSCEEDRPRWFYYYVFLFVLPNM